MSITVRLKFFARLREQLGAEGTLHLPAGSTVGQARDAAGPRANPAASALGAQQAVRAALNQTLCNEAAVLQDGDELAFFPPVTGG